MSDDIKSEFIYVTYKRYLDELNKELPYERSRDIKIRNILLVINILMLSVLVLIEFINLLNPIKIEYIYVFFGVEIVIFIVLFYLVLKVNKYMYSDEVYKQKFDAINKVIPKEKYDEMKELLTIKESFSVYRYIKDFLIKVVGIISVVFGIIKPMVEQLIQPILEKLVGVSKVLTKAPLEQLLAIVGNIGMTIILILIGVILLWFGSVGLIKLYDLLFKVFHLTSYSKSCELLTICELRTYYKKEE